MCTTTRHALQVLGIIGWSIATKVRTGSGLPAGPSGLLGAVEGISYLSLLGGETHGQQQQQQQQRSTQQHIATCHCWEVRRTASSSSSSSRGARSST
jgi:hypothetical protein